MCYVYTHIGSETLHRHNCQLMSVYMNGWMSFPGRVERTGACMGNEHVGEGAS